MAVTQAINSSASGRHGLGLRRRRTIKTISVYGLLLLLSVAFALPFLWMLSTSLKDQRDVFNYPPTFLPISDGQLVFHLENYVNGWTILPFSTYLKNSLIVTLFNVAGNLVSCSLVAFGFARLRSRASNILLIMLLATIMIPREVTIVPRFLLFSKLGLVNTLSALILPAWFGYPFFIFLLRQFFLSIPRDLDEAARIDGASTWDILWKVIFPLSGPALATVAIFSFIGNWSNLLDPLIYIRSEELFTLALGLNLFRGANYTQTNYLMAVSVLTLIPVLVMFFLSQKLFVQGVQLTGMGGR